MASKVAVKTEETVESPSDEIDSKPYVSQDDLYRRSTQYQLWSFIIDDLEAKRKIANEGGKAHATAKFKESFASLKQAEPELFAQFAETELNPSNLLCLITVEEENKFLRFYSNMIIKLSASFKMPTQVKATAISLFKKFYLVNSVMEYHPKMVLFTCLFLAAKSENYFISIDAFVKPLQKVEPSDILDLEFIVLQSLQFTLMVHHPFRPLYGFFLDLQAVLLHPSPAMYDVNIDTIGALYDKAKNWLNDHTLLSDVAFLFTPPQIALAALYDCDRRITDKYLKRKFIKEEAKVAPEEVKVKSEPFEKVNGIKQENGSHVGNGIHDHNSNPHIKQEPGEQTLNAEESAETKEEPKDEKKSNREQYETIVRTIRKCIKIAKQVSEANREESKEIDRKCYYCLHPKKLIEKKISKLKSPAPEAKQETPSEST